MLAWFLLNILQALLTGLANDEAYYWLYARKLAIGYFDHPPMIAVMIRTGYWLIQSELGVRLLVVIFSTLTVPVLYQLSDKKDFRLLAFLLLGVTVFQVYGFIAVPDAPLLLFTALFFLLYKQYLENDNARSVVLLALVVALLLYSKYHGFLVLLFTVLSNPALFKRKSFYLIILLAVLFYLPHIWWQIKNDYPSYQYHVLNKSQSKYDPMDTVSFIGGVLLVSGPLTGALLLYGLFRNRKKDLTTRALRFTFFGFFIFFLFSTLNAAVEANWMAAAVIPAIITGHAYISEREKLRSWAIRLSLLTAVIFLFARINLATDLVPAAGSKVFTEFYGWDEWARQVHQHAGNTPVVIMNSYQRASKYSFSNKTEALSLNNIAYRRNQFDLWDIADSLQGKKVALVMNSRPSHPFPVDSFETVHGKAYMTFIDPFYSYTKIRIETEKDWYHVKPGSDITIPLRFHVPGKDNVRFDRDSLYPVSLSCARYYFQDYDQELFLRDMKTVSLHDGDTLHVHMRSPDKEGPYYIRFGFRNGWLMPELNSRLIRMDVEE